jgi:hypothetical protein
MNYNQLVAELQSYTENVFSVADINTFITQAEQRIANAVQLPASFKYSTLTTSIGVATLTLPADYLATFSVALQLPSGAQAYLMNKDFTFLREAFPTTATGQPQYYALSQAYELTLAPIPSAVYPVNVAYYGYPDSITLPAGTSWLGDNFSSALLYGSLVEAYTFMKGDQDVMALYDTKFKEAMGLLKQLADAKNRQDTFRSDQVRYPVK